MKKYFIAILFSLLTPLALNAATAGQVLGTYSAGPWPQIVRFDPYTNLIWAFKGDGYTPQDWITLNPLTGAPVGTYPAGTPFNIAYDPTSNTAWDYNFTTGQVRKKTASSGAVLSSFSGVDIYAVVDIPTNTLWTLYGNSVRKLNATTGAVLNSYPMGYAGSFFWGIALDSAGFIWVVDNYYNNLYKLNPSNGAITTYYLGDMFPPSGILFDSTTNSLWVINGNWTYGYIQQMNLSGGVMGTYYVSDLLGSVTFDTYTNSLWVANSNQTTVSKLGTGFTNIAPTASIVIPTGATTVTQGNTVAFSGSGSDANVGDSITAYEWREGNCSTGTLLSSASSFFLSNPAVGVRTIFLRVKDSHNTWSTNCPSIVVTVATTPTVTTSSVTGVTQTTASSGGTVVSDGGATVTVSGIAWSTSVNPTTANPKTTTGWAIGGPWTDSMTGLAANTTYHVRAYATNSVGTAYGADVVFTTAVDPTAPTVASPTSAAVTSTGAILGATVTSRGVIPGGTLSSKIDYPTLSGVYEAKVSPDGASLYVAKPYTDMVSHFVRNTLDGTLSAVGTDYYSGPSPTGVIISPDGAFVYVVNTGGNNISRFIRNTSTGALSGRITYLTDLYPSTAAISPDGTSVYVANTGKQTVTKFSRNLSDGTLSLKTNYPAGSNNYNVAVSPDGTSVYVTGFDSATLTKFTRNTTDGTLSNIFDYPINTNPNGVVISPDGAWLYVTNYGSDSVSLFSRNLITGEVTLVIDYPTGLNSQPSGIVISPDGDSLYITNWSYGTISRYTRNASNGTLSGKIDYPEAAVMDAMYMTISPDGQSLYVPNLFSKTISMFGRSPTSGTLSARGVCYSTSPSPSLVNGATCVTAVLSQAVPGVYAVSVAGLMPGTLYYYRGYATNSSGTGYSTDGTFTTGASAPLCTATNPTVIWNPTCITTPAQCSGNPSPRNVAGIQYGTCTDGSIGTPQQACIDVGQICIVAPSVCGNNICESTRGETPITCPRDCKVKYKTF